jgi:Mlc titration factor MtfA (ptsG expression regulator)
MPHVVKLPDPKFHELFQEALEAFANTTPAEFFELVSNHAYQFSLKTEEETAFDLQDVVDFYRTPISELRSASDEKREKRGQYQN